MGVALRERPRTRRPRDPLTVARMQELCQEYEMDLAPAICHNHFYHVTNASQLERIAREGLRPRSEAGVANFADFYVDDNCVYLWGTIGNAQLYSWDHKERFADQQRVILRAEGVRLEGLWPPTKSSSQSSGRRLTKRAGG